MSEPYKASLNLQGIKKTPELYQSYAEVVELLKGIYLTAGDVGTFKDDLIQNERFEDPIITPSTKEKYGKHDQPISKEEIINAVHVDHN